MCNSKYNSFHSANDLCQNESLIGISPLKEGLLVKDNRNYKDVPFVSDAWVIFLGETKPFLHQRQYKAIAYLYNGRGIFDGINGEEDGIQPIIGEQIWTYGQICEFYKRNIFANATEKDLEKISEDIELHSNPNGLFKDEKFPDFYLTNPFI